MKYLLLIPVLFILGCGSTPNTQDYIRYVNKLDPKRNDSSDLMFEFVQPNVDLRAYYNRNSSVNSPDILYQGGAGIAGLLAQVGTYASVINNQRNKLLVKAQADANKRIQGTINKVTDMALSDMVNPSLRTKFSQGSEGSKTVNIRPIFFTNDQNDHINLKMVAWIAKKKSKRKKDKYWYANLIEVQSSTNEQGIANENLEAYLSALLNQALMTLDKDLTGQFSASSQTMENVVVNVNNRQKIMRGYFVEKTCTHSTFRNLHSWLIVRPTPTGDNASVQTKQC